VRSRALLGTLIVALLATCGGDDDCKNACDRLKSCALSSSNLSCDSSCKDAVKTCAECLNDTSCDDIAAGRCAGACGGRVFAKK
jgi:hypothetical protein